MAEPIIAGKYQVLSKLGEGTFGNVFLVQHTELSTKYAIKVLKKELSSNDQFVARFKKEAEILLRFHHSGSVQLRDFGKTEDGLYYMATDFCEGTSLESILTRKGRLDLAEAINFAAEIIDIVAAAHDFGIVHRDIKPGNIMVSQKASGKQEIQILDFGIASLREEARSKTQDSETKQSEVQPFNCGTPVYMAPEQCAGEPDIDHLADIYACGIILYEMLAGWVPFDSQDVLQILLKHLTQPVPPFPKQFAIPLSLEEVVMKSLEKERNKRYSSAHDFAAACRQQLSLIKPSPVTQIAEVKPLQTATPSPENKSADKRILCLDDNEMILQIMQHLLQKEGYHVFIANNFANIHDYVFQENVPLLVCDVNMPGLPGNKICQMLKKAKPDLKIILFSNIPERDLERLAKESNADDWLSKNAKPNTWLEKIKTFF